MKTDHHFHLISIAGELIMVYTEKNGRYVKCILSGDLANILHELHDVIYIYIFLFLKVHSKPLS